ncbi:MAG: phospho-sugar mutase [Chthoniobacterales bacterium]|nr:phospho-sugar mutase [Chthoniobacterales bacterium]
MKQQANRSDSPQCKREEQISSTELPLQGGLFASILEAVQAGFLLQSSAENMQRLMKQTASSLPERVIAELIEQKAWKELNNRFFRTLAFGTGGLRGKTIGDIVTTVEAGTKRSDGRPQFSCIGTNTVNNYNIIRATRGLVTYVLRWHQQKNRSGNPKICISYDTRFFSREFAELAAKVISEHGCDALLFQEPRSTPELSFAVRECAATAGINITASHNPPAYNGYKVYFEDGAQVIEPHASSIITLVDQMEGDQYQSLPQEQCGKIIFLGKAVDESYKKKLRGLILQPSLFKKNLKVVYTPLHGVGGTIIVPLLESVGVQCSPVFSQMQPDGFFSTVKSPNPENSEALTLGIALAEQEKADLVIATDPDADRMGVAVRNASGSLELLTGNQIGSLIAWYRLKTLFEQGLLDEKNKKNALLVKSIVTTDLQKAIAEKFGIRCVETLTGFKYIGAKLTHYEHQLSQDLQKKYRILTEEESRQARLEESSYLVFGGEESYGYSLGDFVRDKDANAAALGFCEVAAHCLSQKITLSDLLDQIYCDYGYYYECGESLSFEGAEGSLKMQSLINSYIQNPFTSINGEPVTAFQNYAAEMILDSEGEILPKESMLIFKLHGDHRVVVRPSGTEPKIKFYFFSSYKPKSKRFSLEELSNIKRNLKKCLEDRWKWLQDDVAPRI